MKMVTVQVYQNYMEANIARGMLEEEGIHAFLDNENTMTIIPMLGTAGGGIRLMVPEEQKEQAVAILLQIDAERKSKTPCPKCGSTDVEFVTTPRNPANWLAAISTSLFGDYAIAPGKVYHCFTCGHEFPAPEEVNLPDQD